MSTITISGPGGIINYEAQVIIQALIAAGVTVKVENSHPDSRISSMNTKDLIIAEKERIEKHGHARHADVVVNHCPWGG